MIQKCIIGFRCVDVRHTGENIANRITIVLYEWKLENRIIAFTLDNASPNNRVIEIVRPVSIFSVVVLFLAKHIFV